MATFSQTDSKSSTGRVDLVQKLLARALDPACEIGEAENSACKLVRVARRESITFDVLTSSLAIVVTKEPEPAEPPEPPDACDIRIPFGKHRGRSLRWIVTNDLSYAQWLADEANIDPRLRSAIWATLDYIVGVAA